MNNNPISIRLNFFLSIKNEIKWLNNLGALGYKLIKKSVLTYTFIKTEQSVIYDVVWLDSSPETDDNRAYIKKRESRGWEFIASRSCFIYLCASSNIIPIMEYDKIKLMRNRFRSLSIFTFVLSLFLCGYAEYNYIWMQRFNDMNYVVKANDAKLVLFKSFLAGKNPAQVLLVALLPFAALAISYFIVYIFEYTAWNNKLKGSGEEA